MWNDGLDKSQAGIKIAGRNNDTIDNLRYAESEEELKSLLMRVKGESENAGLKLNIQNTKIMTSSPISSCQIERKEVEAVTDFIFLGSKITDGDDCSHEIKRFCLLEGKLWQTYTEY